jgi:hypothetical protein
MPEAERKKRARAATDKWIANNYEYIKEVWRKSSEEYRKQFPGYNVKSVKAWKTANPIRWSALQLKAKHKRRALLAGQKHAGIDPGAWAGQLEVFNHQCAYCLGPAVELDHLQSIATGGPDEIENAVPACRRCNSSKWKKPLLQWLLTSNIAQEALATAQ